VARPADLVAVSAHKFGGPKGVGALVVRQPVKVAPILHGGGQERDRRSGTHNVAGIVAMAAAMQATVAERAGVVARVGALRDRLADGLLTAVPDSHETGPRDIKVAGNCHVSFGGVESEALLMLLDGAGVCASAGSACASGAIEPSHVLAAMGVPRERALGSLRLTLGRDTTSADVDLALAVIPPAVARLRDAAR
jgi:cysteine desulfurase